MPQKFPLWLLSRVLVMFLAREEKSTRDVYKYTGKETNCVKETNKTWARNVNWRTPEQTSEMKSRRLDTATANLHIFHVDILNDYGIVRTWCCYNYYSKLLYAFRCISLHSGWFQFIETKLSLKWENFILCYFVILAW